MISKSISTSTRLADVSTFAALLFSWVIPHCDDYGHLEATPKIVKGIVVPLREETAADVEKALASLVAVGLIELYEAEGRKYLEVTKWEEHQTFKSDRPKNASCPTRNPLDSKRNPNGKIVLSKLSEVKISKVTTVSVAEAFDAFWQAYPRRVSKVSALKAWKRLAPDDRLCGTILLALDSHKRSEQWTKDEGRFIPHPATWLNQRRWEDDLKVAKGPAAGGKFDSVKTTKI